MGLRLRSNESQTAFPTKTLWAAALLDWGFVVANVTARYGDAPSAPPRPNPKSPAAAPLTIFSQALTNNASALVSRSPVRLTWSETGAGVGLESLCEFHNRFSLASILRDGEDNLRHK